MPNETLCESRVLSGTNDSHRIMFGLTLYFMYTMNISSEEIIFASAIALVWPGTGTEQMYPNSTCMYSHTVKH